MRFHSRRALPPRWPSCRRMIVIRLADVILQHRNGEVLRQT